MLSFIQCLFPETWRPGRAAAAGAIATAAYSIVMEAERSVSAHHFDDVACLRGWLGDSTLTRNDLAVLAWIIHFLNGVALAEVYALVEKRLLPGPHWLKGALFGEAFVLAVWPVTPLVDRSHPLIRKGRLPPLATKAVFWQNVLRHLVFGIVLF